MKKTLDGWLHIVRSGTGRKRRVGARIVQYRKSHARLQTKAMTDETMRSVSSWVDFPTSFSTITAAVISRLGGERMKPNRFCHTVRITGNA
jgi:hypothetical protein